MLRGKRAKHPLSGFLGEQVKIATTIDVQDGVDEDGNPRWGKQAYMGVLIGFDDNYLLLGIMSEPDSPPHFAVSQSNITHIEFYGEDPLQPVTENGILN